MAVAIFCENLCAIWEIGILLGHIADGIRYDDWFYFYHDTIAIVMLLVVWWLILFLFYCGTIGTLC